MGVRGECLSTTTTCRTACALDCSLWHFLCLRPYSREAEGGKEVTATSLLAALECGHVGVAVSPDRRPCLVTMENVIKKKKIREKLERNVGAEGGHQTAAAATEVRAVKCCKGGGGAGIGESLRE